VPGRIVGRYGPWKEAARIAGSMAGDFQRAVERSTLREAHFLRGKIVEGITSGAPAGKPFKPHAPLTIALRGGSGKILIQSGALRNSITVVKIGGGATTAAFVGVQRTNKRANLAEIHEEGRTIRVTEKMRRYLMARLREAGAPPPPPGGGGGKTVIKIPARPFMGPVFERYGKPEDVAQRFWTSVSKELGGKLGRP
jgi:phage gpG-like protein